VQLEDAQRQPGQPGDVVRVDPDLLDPRRGQPGQRGQPEDQAVGQRRLDPAQPAEDLRRDRRGRGGAVAERQLDHRLAREEVAGVGDRAGAGDQPLDEAAPEPQLVALEIAEVVERQRGEQRDLAAAQRRPPRFAVVEPGQLALHRDQLAARLAPLEQGVGEHQARLVVVGIGDDRGEEVAVLHGWSASQRLIRPRSLSLTPGRASASSASARASARAPVW
jgi:hypothetical protein